MADLAETIGKARSLIEKIEAARGSTVLVMVSPRILDDRTAFELNKILRSIGRIDCIDVLLESEGGSIDMAYKMLTLLRSYSRRVRVVVPFFAKSAATIIALGADDLALCQAGELGPIDPQVVDPQTDEYVPAHSVVETMDFIGEIADPVTRIALAEKVPILLIGSYRVAEKKSRQYLDEILAEKAFDEDKREKLLEVFTQKFFSHSYPMNRDFLTKNGIFLGNMDEPTEALFVDIHTIWQEYLYSIDVQSARETLILQTKETEFVSIPHAYSKPADKPEE